MRLSVPLLCLVTALPFEVQATKNPKRGLAFAESGGINDIAQATQSNSVISWQYNWASSPPSYLASSGIPFVPMQWGSGGIGSLPSSIQLQRPTPAAILGFNEPDLFSQSNLSPNAAAQLWKQYMQPLKQKGIRLGSPAITNGPNGQEWMAEFLGNCTGCEVDFLAFHWYGTGIGAFYDYIWSMHGRFPNHNLWVTEFAETSTDNAVLDFCNQTTRYMDTLDWIERYAWFGFFRQDGSSHYNLLDANGKLNELGTTYINAK